MSYCSGSKKATVKATYPDGEVAITSYNPPLDYTIQQTDPQPGQCYADYRINPTTVRAWRSTYGSQCGQIQTPPSMIINNAKILSIGVFDGKWGVEIESVTGVSIRTNWGNNYRIYHYDGCRRARFSTGYTYASSLTVEIIRTDGLPDDCGESECVFEITDSTGVIYTRTESECPINVTVECAEECPPNTHCECVHGGVKCCFDDNGMLIKRIKL